MDDYNSQPDCITFRIAVTQDLLADFTDEEVGKLFRYMLSERVVAEVGGDSCRQVATLGSRDLTIAYKALKYSAIYYTPELLPDFERKANGRRTEGERMANGRRTEGERKANGRRTEGERMADTLLEEKETNKETEDIPPTPPIEDKENNKEKEEGFQPAYAGLSESSNEDYDAVAVVNARARGGKDISLCIPVFILQFNRCMARSNIPSITSISNRRKSYLLARIKEHGIIAVYRAIILASRSSFLNGGGSQGFTANFDWIFRPNNFPKILEGTYNDRQNIFITQPSGGCYTDTAQQQRLQQYAGVAAYWRQQADNDPNALVRQEQPVCNVSYQQDG